MVLKDCWASSDRQREGKIHEKLRNVNLTDAFRGALDSSFLTVERHGDVSVSSKSDRMPLVLTLEEMTRPGYIAAVHCDVSTGHILIDSHGKARLSDLEYAKDMSDKSDPESRIVRCIFLYSSS